MATGDITDNEHQRAPLFPDYRLEELGGLRVARLVQVRGYPAPQAWTYPKLEPPTYTEEDLERDHGGGEYEITALGQDQTDRQPRTVRLMGEPLDWPEELKHMQPGRGGGGGFGGGRGRGGGGGGGGGGPRFPMDDRRGGGFDDEDDDERHQRPYARQQPQAQPTSIPVDGIPVIPGVDPSQTMLVGVVMQLAKSERDSASSQISHANQLVEMTKQGSQLIEDRNRQLLRENDNLHQAMSDLRRQFGQHENTLMEDAKRRVDIEREENQRLRTQLNLAEQTIIKQERELNRVQAEMEVGKMTRDAEKHLAELRNKIDAASGPDKDQARMQMMMQLGAQIIQSPAGEKLLRAFGLGDVAGVFAAGSGGGGPPGAAGIP